MIVRLIDDDGASQGGADSSWTGTATLVPLKSPTPNGLRMRGHMRYSILAKGRMPAQTNKRWFLCPKLSSYLLSWPSLRISLCIKSWRRFQW